MKAIQTTSSEFAAVASRRRGGGHKWGGHRLRWCLGPWGVGVVGVPSPQAGHRGGAGGRVRRRRQLLGCRWPGDEAASGSWVRRRQRPGKAAPAAERGGGGVGKQQESHDGVGKLKYGGAIQKRNKGTWRLPNLPIFIGKDMLLTNICYVYLSVTWNVGRQSKSTWAPLYSSV
jgi:hypothetical protein